MTTRLNRLLHLVDRGVEGRLLLAEGELLKEAIADYDMKVRHYEALLVDQLKKSVEQAERPLRELTNQELIDKINASEMGPNAELIQEIRRRIDLLAEKFAPLFPGLRKEDSDGKA